MIRGTDDHLVSYAGVKPLLQEHYGYNVPLHGVR
jgi:hypothetical protein